MPQNMKPALDSPNTGVVITGGASGLGLASATALAAVGRPVALWDLHQERAEEQAKRIADEHGVTTVGLGVDVRSLDAMREAAEVTRSALPSIGGLVHCAGVVDQDNLDGLTQETWDTGIAVHLRPIPFLVQIFLDDLKANPGSAVVATASINATLGNAINPVYTAAKGGVLSLVRSLADRLAHDGIRINAISPGMIRTPMLGNLVAEDGTSVFDGRILMGRVGEPAEIGRLVRFLLSDEATYITAAELVADGGNISSQR